MRLDEAIKILKNNNYILEDKYMDDMDSELDDIIKNSSVKDDVESEKPIKKEISLKKPQKKPEKENFMGVKVGDIFDAYWGYSMTLHSFYQITSIKGQKVTIIELEKEWVDGDGFQGHVMPIPNVARKNAYNDIKSFYILKKGYKDQPCIKLDKYRTAYPWDGQKQYEDHMD